MDARELRNFLVARGSSGVCPFCGHDEWADVGLDPGYALRITGETPTGTQFLGIKVTAIACTNCAFLRLHSDDVMLDKTYDIAEEGH